MLEKLCFLGLKPWEFEFITRYSKGDESVAIKMAADHLLRNALLTGKPIQPILDALRSVGYQEVFLAM